MFLAVDIISVCGNVLRKQSVFHSFVVDFLWQNLKFKKIDSKMAPKDNDDDKSKMRKVIEKNLLLLTTLAGVIIGITMGT